MKISIFVQYLVDGVETRVNATSWTVEALTDAKLLAAVTVFCI